MKKFKGKPKNKVRKRKVKRNSISIQDSSENEQEGDISKLQNFQKKQIIVNRLLDISKKKKKEEEENKKKEDGKKSKIIFGSKILGVIIGGILSLFL